jgi:hypothetical protein
MIAVVVVLILGIGMIVTGLAIPAHLPISTLFCTLGSWIFGLSFAFLTFLYCDRREKKRLKALFDEMEKTDDENS